MAKILGNEVVSTEEFNEFVKTTLIPLAETVNRQNKHIMFFAWAAATSFIVSCVLLVSMFSK